MSYFSVYRCGTIFLSLFKDTEPYINMDTNKEVISRLKFIGKINKDEKINVRYMFVQPDDITTRFSRTFYNKDNRRNTLDFVRTTIDRSFEIISTYMTSEKPFERTMCANILKDLEGAKKGIINLKETYLTDIKFCCDMDTILQDIDAKLASFMAAGLLNDGQVIDLDLETEDRKEEADEQPSPEDSNKGGKSRKKK